MFLRTTYAFSLVFIEYWTEAFYMGIHLVDMLCNEIHKRRKNGNSKNYNEMLKASKAV